MKNNIASVEDNITLSLIKDATQVIKSKLAKLFTECFNQGKIPAYQKNAV